MQTPHSRVWAYQEVTTLKREPFAHSGLSELYQIIQLILSQRMVRRDNSALNDIAEHELHRIHSNDCGETQKIIKEYLLKTKKGH
jgi:hypothetical protein